MWPWLGIRPGPFLCHLEVLKVPSGEEGVLQTRQPLGLEAVPRNRGLPITGSQSPGPNQTNKQTKHQHFLVFTWISISIAQP